MNIYREKKINNVGDVVSLRLCLGCGICIPICPESNIKLVDIISIGLRPVVNNKLCTHCKTCLSACPGISLSTENLYNKYNMKKNDEQKKWGKFLEIWEGYSTDEEIRYKGSSGGICTALSVYCIEKGIASGILHVGSDPEIPYRNRTYRSTKREELISMTGSRYSPAAPGERVDIIKDNNGKTVVVGKPCDIAGFRKAEKILPDLRDKIALKIGFFCAGTPSSEGTLDLLRKHSIDKSEIKNIRYRGKGWPGMATFTFKDKDRTPCKLTYNDSWGFIQKYRPFRCYLCPDLTAEFADISVGDPWYREIRNDAMGRSIILIRTEEGKTIFKNALEEGYISAKRVKTNIIYLSQKNLLGKRRAIWGRLLALKMLGLPYPRLKGFHLFENWLDLSLNHKLKSIFGTIKRIYRRNYFSKLKI